MQRAKGYDPDPLDVPPLFQLPARPVEMLRWLITKYMWTQPSPSTAKFRRSRETPYSSVVSLTTQHEHRALRSVFLVRTLEIWGEFHKTRHDVVSPGAAYL